MFMYWRKRSSREGGHDDSIESKGSYQRAIIFALVWEGGIYCARGWVDLPRSIDSSPLIVAGRHIIRGQVLIGSVWELVDVFFWSKYEAGGGGLRIEHEVWNRHLQVLLEWTRKRQYDLQAVLRIGLRFVVVHGKWDQVSRLFFFFSLNTLFRSVI